MCKSSSMKKFIISLLFVLIITIPCSHATSSGGTAPPWARPIRITILSVTEFPPGGMIDYEIHFEIRNYNSFNATIIITHTLILPDGSSSTWSERQVIPGNMSMGAYIAYQYDTDLYGRYTYKLTLEDPRGFIFDEKSVSWIRENP